jgi:hypothetical protein
MRKCDENDKSLFCLIPSNCHIETRAVVCSCGEYLILSVTLAAVFSKTSSGRAPEPPTTVRKACETVKGVQRPPPEQDTEEAGLVNIVKSTSQADFLDVRKGRYNSDSSFQQILPKLQGFPTP